MPARKRYKLEQFDQDLVITVPNRGKADLSGQIRGEFRNEASFIAALLTLKGKMLNDIGFADANALVAALSDDVTTFAVHDMKAADFDALYEQGKKLARDLAYYAQLQGIQISAPVMRYSLTARKIAPSFAVEGGHVEQLSAFKEQLDSAGIFAKSLTKLKQRYIDIVALPEQDVLQLLQNVIDKPKGRIGPSDPGQGHSR